MVALNVCTNPNVHSDLMYQRKGHATEADPWVKTAYLSVLFIYFVKRQAVEKAG